jgi:multidrug efflux system membrane fusion protein
MKSFFDQIKSVFMVPKYLAILLVCLLLFWLFVIGEQKHSLEEPPSSKDKELANSVSTVEVTTLQSEPFEQQIIVQGQLLPWRRVSLQSEVSGRVVSIERSQGDAVQEGEVVLNLSDEGRSALLKQAQAKLQSSRLELKSAKTLKSAKFVSETELSRLSAELAESEANVASAKLAFDYGKPKAPFTGLVDRRHVEVGDQVNPGTPLFDIVQVDKLRFNAYVPQQDVQFLEEGQTVNLTLLSGEEFTGVLSFISAAADESTRSYYIEVSVVNPDQKRIAGASATLTISLPEISSHRVSPALLSLDNQGKPGLFAVDNANVVEYFPVNILSVGEKAIVSGLPETVRLISVGAGFVKTGQTVEVSEKAQ